MENSNCLKTKILIGKLNKNVMPLSFRIQINHAEFRGNLSNFSTSDVFVYSHFTRHFNAELKIRPDIQYPACAGRVVDPDWIRIQ
jgi:hypothetical protein